MKEKQRPPWGIDLSRGKRKNPLQSRYEFDRPYHPPFPPRDKLPSTEALSSNRTWKQLKSTVADRPLRPSSAFEKNVGVKVSEQAPSSSNPIFQPFQTFRDLTKFTVPAGMSQPDLVSPIATHEPLRSRSMPGGPHLRVSTTVSSSSRSPTQLTSSNLSHLPPPKTSGGGGTLSSDTSSALTSYFRPRTARITRDRDRSYLHPR